MQACPILIDKTSLDDPRQLLAYKVKYVLVSDRGK